MCLSWKVALFAALSELSVLGCSASAPPPAKEPPKPCEALPPELEILATDRVNATAAGEGRPVQLRIYQLKADTALQSASFEEIWQNDASVLEKDLVKVDEQTVYPGRSSRLKIELTGGADKLALVALFREPQGKDWFVTYDLDVTAPPPPCPTKPPTITVFLDRMQIQDGQGREASELGKSEASDANASEVGAN